MSHVNAIGMALYLLLAVFGGFLTGLFSRYAFEAAVGDFGKLAAIVLSLVFYIAPIWAIFGLFKDDDLDIFYGLLIISFIYGIIFYNKFEKSESQTLKQDYFPPDDD